MKRHNPLDDFGLNDKNMQDAASGNHKRHEKHGDVVATGFGGSRWYQYKDGTVKTYLQLLSEHNTKK